MTKKARVWLIIAAVLMVLGLVCCGIAINLAKGDFTVFSTAEYQTKEYELSEDYIAISVSTDTADIVFHPSTDGKTRLICRENVKRPHSVSVEDDFLKISVQDLTKWHDHISIGSFYEQEVIDIYLPRDTYNALYIDTDTSDVSISKGFLFMTMDIKTDTGDVVCSSPAAGDMEISTSTGDITLKELNDAGMPDLETNTGDISLTDVNCLSLAIESSSGDITLKNVCANTFTAMVISTGTGDVELISCDGYSIEIETDTGDVRGSLLSEKRVFAESDTGDIDIPPLPDEFGLGFCRVETDTGDIRIEIKP